jgi:hypothetical protein
MQFADLPQSIRDDVALAATAWKALSSANIRIRGQTTNWRNVIQAVKIIGSVADGVPNPHDLDLLIQLTKGTRLPFRTPEGELLPSLYQPMLLSLQHAQHYIHFVYADKDTRPDTSIDVTAMFTPTT